MVQKINFKDIPFTICGPGRIPDEEVIDLAESVKPLDGTENGYPVHVIQAKNTFSMKIGGTVFDVTTHFNTEGRQSVLQQFRDLILSENLL